MINDSNLENGFKLDSIYNSKNNKFLFKEKKTSYNNIKYNRIKLNSFFNLNSINTNLVPKNNQYNLCEMFLNKLNLNQDIGKETLINNNKEILNKKAKIIKYNKIVYINKFLIKEKKIKKNQKFLTRKRCSKYRGVSKNGNGWQVLMMHKNDKSYIGTYNSEELAGRIYDIASIKRIGFKAKTNFLYKYEQILKIIETNFDFKSKSISNIVSKLIK